MRIDSSVTSLSWIPSEAVTGINKAIFGTVKSIGLTSTSSAGVASYPVVIAVTGHPAGLYDGISAAVKIIYERRTNVLTVPSGAVRTVNGTSVVTQAGADGKQVATTVTVGETVGEVTEIVSGLSSGDKVLQAVVQTTKQAAKSSTSDQPTGMPTGMPGGMPTGGPGGQNNG